MPANDLIIFRKGSGAQWTSNNPILASGEPGYDVTNNILKIGDGVSNWQSLSSHKHDIGDINSFASGVADVINTEMVGGSGISLIYNSQNNTATISVTGIVSGGVGAQGTMGIQGIQGLEGIQGTIGTQGIQGTIGTQGIQGLEGIQGTVGTQGIQGTSGTIDQLYSIGNSSTTKTLSLSSGNIQTVILNDNCIFTMPSASAAANLTIFIMQTGSFTATFTGVKWAGGVVPTITTGSDKIDIISFLSDGTNWYGGIVKNLS